MSAGAEGSYAVHAWVADVDGPPLRETLRFDGVRDDDVLVRVEAVGVCHSDLMWMDGSRPSPFPLVAGHEGAGTVVATGPAATGRVQVGQRVVMSFASCGTCGPCVTGRPSYCHDFRQLNSGFGGGREQQPRLFRESGEFVTRGFFGQSSFADLALTNPRTLVPLPDWVPSHVAAPFGCGVQTGAGAVFNAFGVRPGESLVVLGSGAVGLSAVMAAAVVGAAVVVAVDPVPARRDLAVELGATHTLTPAQVAEGALLDLLPHGFDWALDTSGRPEVVEQGLQALATTGTMGILAAGRTGSAVTVPLRDLVVGRRVRGLVEGDSVPQEFIPRLLDLWRSGRFPVERLITTFPDDVTGAVHAMQTGAAVKPVVTFTSAGSQ
jgi:aryl-alcohol dehydrogenase